MICPICKNRKWDGEHGHPWGSRRTPPKTRWCIGPAKVQKKYYLDEELAKAVAHRALDEGITQSAYAERAIRNLLAEWRGA